MATASFSRAGNAPSSGVSSTGEPSSYSPRKDAVLHAVGRTLVNFRRLEHNLKLLSRLGPIEGTPASVAQQMEARVKLAAEYTLGQAIGAWFQVLDGVSVRRMPTDDLSDTTIRSRIDFLLDTTERESHAEALKTLLAARNALVHGELLLIDWTLTDACDRLIEHLEGLNDAIAAQMEFVVHLLKSLGELRSDRYTILPGDQPGHFIVQPETE